MIKWGETNEIATDKFYVHSKISTQDRLYFTRFRVHILTTLERKCVRGKSRFNLKTRNILIENANIY